MSRYYFIEAQQHHYPVRLLCQLVEVPASGYYAWQQVQQQVVAKSEPAWETALVKVFGVHKRCYGTRQLRVELRRKGYRIGRQRLHTAMRHRGLHALQPKAFTPRTTDSTHGLRCALNRVWVSDNTCSPLVNGDWAYLCTFQDMASKQVVGWQVGVTMPEELVTSALRRAYSCTPTGVASIVATLTGNCCATTKPSARRVAAATAMIMPPAQGFGCLWSRFKTEVLERRERPVLLTWPTHKLASQLILTTTVTSASFYN